eukprot:scaffold11237_cov102-Phaeocystis_antarctica.AAC.2
MAPAAIRRFAKEDAIMFGAPLRTSGLLGSLSHRSFTSLRMYRRSGNPDTRGSREYLVNIRCPLRSG